MTSIQSFVPLFFWVFISIWVGARFSKLENATFLKALGSAIIIFILSILFAKGLLTIISFNPMACFLIFFILINPIIVHLIYKTGSITKTINISMRSIFIVVAIFIFIYFA